MKIFSCNARFSFLSTLLIFWGQGIFALNIYEKKTFDLFYNAANSAKQVKVADLQLIYDNALKDRVKINYSARAEGSNYSMLMVALYYGAKFDVIDYLVKRGADCNARLASGETALHFLARGYTVSRSMSGRDSFQLFLYLLNHGARITDQDGKNLLLIAAESKQLDIVKYLLEKARANVNVRDENGLTPLMRAMLFPAVQNNDRKTLPLVKFLVEVAKADVAAKDNNGKTVIDYIKDKFFPMAWDMDDYKDAGDYLKARFKK